MITCSSFIAVRLYGLCWQTDSFVRDIVKLVYLSVSAYTPFMMGRYKRPGLKAAVKCEDCGRSFGNERALGQHLNSKAHALVINHDEDILPIVRSPPVTFDTPSFQLLVPRPMDFDDKPEKEVEFPRKDEATSNLYILMPIPGKGQGLIAAQDISKGTRILSEKPLFQIPRFGLEQPAIKKAIGSKLNLLSQDDQRTFLSLHNNTLGTSDPLTGIAKTNALPLGTNASEGELCCMIQRLFGRFMGSTASIRLYVRNRKLFMGRG
jgi:hypothetical protein